MKLALQVLCEGIVSGLPFTQEREGGSPGLDGVERVEEAAGKHLTLKLLGQSSQQAFQHVINLPGLAGCLSAPYAYGWIPHQDKILGKSFPP